jgi:mannose-6-phosphate isomerase-like protein (cupin superfamily)
MHIASKADVKQPIESPLGEIVHELVGASEESGGAGKHSLALVTIPPGKSSARHYHPVAEETYYILRGVARMVVDGRSFRLSPGQACFIQPPEQHQIFNAGDGDLEFIAVCAPAWTPDDSVFV